jgi:DNA-binding MarR family transcriptional regulator
VSKANGNEPNNNELNGNEQLGGMDDEVLRLSNQLCFPLYAAAKGVVGRYKPYLDEIDLTYTQYIAMMVLWEKGSVAVGELGRSLYLDSGTLTPVLKRLEAKKLIRRERSSTDERVVIATLTQAGKRLKVKAVEVPHKMSHCMPLSAEDAGTIYKLLYKLLEQSGEQGGDQVGEQVGEQADKQAGKGRDTPTRSKTLTTV